MLTCPPCLALSLTALPFVPGSLHRCPRTVYLKDAHPSPRPRHRCQPRASMSPTSHWLEKKQFFGKCCLPGSSVQGLCPTCRALLAAADGRASPKVAVHGESLAGMQHAPPILFHGSEARLVKEAFLSLGAREKTHHCFLSWFNSLPLPSPNCVRENYLQTEQAGESWETSAIFLAAGMLSKGLQV